MTLDYGAEAPWFLQPHRTQGTLRGYARHLPADSPWHCPGEQDLTTHVNFTALRRAGEGAGLCTRFDGEQRLFLTEWARRAWEPGAQFGGWGASERRQLQVLTHPDHFGRAFRVLVQSTPEVNS
jgi:SAM-dependent MidA family methyltransferase